MTAPAVLLTLAVQPPVWPADAMQDVIFVVNFRNDTGKEIDIYPEMAHLDFEGGWFSPRWSLRIDAEAAGEAKPLVLPAWIRDYYGPPGMPPDRKTFNAGRRRLGPGKSIEHRLPACWIPSSLITAEHLRGETLDPQGMDELRDKDLRGVAALVFHRDCPTVRVLQERGVSFLRPGLVTFVRGTRRLRITATYSQETWGGFFVPAQGVKLSAPAVAVDL